MAVVSPAPSRAAIVAFLCAAAQLACAPAGARPPDSASPAREPPRAGLRYAFDDPARAATIRAALPEIEAALAGRNDVAGAVGFAFGLIVDGALVHVSARGVADTTTRRPVDRDTVFRIASVTKTFSALGVLRLRDEGRLSLDDPLERHVPEAARLLYPTSDAPPLRLRHLLTQTSGLPLNGGYDFSATSKGVSEADVTGALVGLQLVLPPGEVYLYSNLGFSLLGPVITHASGMPYRQFMRDRILAPLGLASAAWDAADVPAARRSISYRREGERLVPLAHERLGASEADGGLFLSLADLARWAAYHLDAFPPRDAPETGPVKRSTVREALSPSVLVRVRPPLGHKAGGPVELTGIRAVGGGHAWAVSDTCEGEKIAWHDGGIEGFVSLVQVLPRQGIGLVSLANSEVDLHAAHTAVLRVLREKGALAPRRLQPSAELVAAAERWVALFNAWNEEGYDALYTDYFRVTVDREAHRGWVKRESARVGACTLGPPREITSLRVGSFEIRCARASGQLGLKLDGHTDRIASSTGVTWTYTEDAPSAAPAPSERRCQGW